jgi:hypothetical protein
MLEGSKQRREEGRRENARRKQAEERRGEEERMLEGSKEREGGTREAGSYPGKIIPPLTANQIEDLETELRDQTILAFKTDTTTARWDQIRMVN